jgi:hypothetical protein
VRAAPRRAASLPVRCKRTLRVVAWWAPADPAA